MEDIVNVLVNNGIGVAVIAYFIFRDYSFNKQLNDTLKSLEDSVELIKEYFLEKDR